MHSRTAARRVNATSIRSKALSRQESPSAAWGNAGWQWVWRPKPEAVHPENHFRRKRVPPTIDAATYSDHDSSIRTPGLCWVRERLFRATVWLAPTMLHFRLLSM